MPNPSLYPPKEDPSAIATRLIRKAHNQDGLPEIVVGLTFLVVAAFSYAEMVLPRESIGFKAAVLALALLIPVLSIGAPRALRWLRRRYLIHRVGYVVPNPIGRKQVGGAFVLAVAMVGLFFGVVTQSSRPDRWALAATGLLGGALVALLGQLRRFIIGGALMGVTGIVTAFSGVPLQAGFAILFGSQGLLAVISGATVFSRFIRQPIEPAS
jgi:hypothetical protein